MRALMVASAVVAAALLLSCSKPPDLSLSKQEGRVLATFRFSLISILPEKQDAWVFFSESQSLQFPSPPEGVLLGGGGTLRYVGSVERSRVWHFSCEPEGDKVRVEAEVNDNTGTNIKLELDLTPGVAAAAAKVCGNHGNEVMVFAAVPEDKKATRD